MIPSIHEIKHFRASATGRLVDIILPLLMDAEYPALDLIRIGAVYIDKIRETNPDATVQCDAYVRIHTRPRRFPMASKINWKQRILHICEHFVVINKPGGVPVHASTDNILETCVAEVERLVGGSLHPLHRLDVPTHGLLAFGKSTESSAHFCSMMRQRHVHKEYLALTYRAPPLGLMVHWMKPSERSPKEVEREAQEDNWQECKLLVKKVNTMPITLLSATARQVIAAQLRCSSLHGEERASPQSTNVSFTAENTFEVRIELLTGRTHQIRAQLSREGYFLVGDEMYHSEAKCTSDKLRKGEDADGTAADEASRSKTLAREMEVEGTLALQAVSMRFPAMCSASLSSGTESSRRGPRKLSKRQRREARMKMAEEESQADAAGGGNDVHSGSVVDKEGDIEEDDADRGGKTPSEGEFLVFELGRPWWREESDT